MEGVRVTLSANRALVVVDSPTRKTTAASTGRATRPSTGGSHSRRAPGGSWRSVRPGCPAGTRGGRLPRVGESTTTSARFHGAKAWRRTLARPPLVMLSSRRRPSGSELVEPDAPPMLALKPISALADRPPEARGRVRRRRDPGGPASGFVAVALVDDGGLGGGARDRDRPARRRRRLCGAGMGRARDAPRAPDRARLRLHLGGYTRRSLSTAVRFLGVRRYTLAVIHGLDGARLATIRQPALRGRCARPPR